MLKRVKLAAKILVGTYLTIAVVGIMFFNIFPDINYKLKVGVLLALYIGWSVGTLIAVLRGFDLVGDNQ